MSTSRTLLLTALFVAAALRPATAQTPTGSIDGVVVDGSGAVIPGVTVVVTHQPTGGSREVVTDAQGVFRAPLLAVGPYTLKAGLSGFKAFEQKDVSLTSGRR